MKFETIELQPGNGIAIIWFNRPDIRNAINPVLLAEVSKALTLIEKDPSVRAVVLGGRGAAFCAGADLKWMLEAGKAKKAAASKMGGLEEVLHQLAEFPKPTLARVHGAAFAGGMGFVSACDIAVASSDAVFCLSEVKIGLIPAIISPYVVRAMGERMAHRYFLSLLLVNQRKYDEALAVASADNTEWSRLAGLAHVYCASGPRAEAEATLQELIAKYSDIATVHIAIACAAGGEIDAAFEWLDRAFTQRAAPLILLLAWSHVFKALVPDPRWTALLKKMQLAP